MFVLPPRCIMRRFAATAPGPSTRWLAGSLILLMGACATPRPSVSVDAKREMLALLMPKRIKIVEPFTRAAYLHRVEQPDGIELFVQAVNRFDDPGLMIVGDVRVELFEYVQASGDRRGRRLEHWDVALTESAQQESYWNGLTQMYEFRLGINAKSIPPADRYILAVTYVSPFDDRLTDESVVDFRETTAHPAGSFLRNP